jgi:polysaccharide pyruvyl transferase WcaK-like protein
VPVAGCTDNFGERCHLRILVDQSGYELLNMGDAAMLQSCVLRLSRQWPDAEIAVIARSPADLAPYCPDAVAVARSDGQVFAHLLPRRYRPVWQSAAPYFSGRFGHRRVLRSQPRTALEAVRAADVVVAAGGGYMTDTFRWHATGVLGVLALAQRLGKPTAMFGQGIGPVRQRMLRMQARAVLPELAVLGLREGRMGRDLALSFGARPDGVQVTGDDALELIKKSETSDGYALGVNVRVTGYAGVDHAMATAIGDVVAQAAAALDVPILALPVSRRGADADLGAIRGMFQRCHLDTDVILEDLATPQDLAAATARCHAIVTGSYHAAVFGLAQGVPTVCVSKSSYYDGKFNGLSALFPDSCVVISLDSADFDDRLRTSIRQAWQLPAPLRASARDTAVGLRDAGRAAYAQFRVAVEKTL